MPYLFSHWEILALMTFVCHLPYELELLYVEMLHVNVVQ